jgi:hypothetical protein
MLEIQLARIQSIVSEFGSLDLSRREQRRYEEMRRICSILTPRLLRDNPEQSLINITRLLTHAVIGQREARINRHRMLYSDLAVETTGLESDLSQAIIHIGIVDRIASGIRRAAQIMFSLFA